ncbi:MAG: hypothetical protein GF317_01220 [Candidatus Lokiarchaeota archaeon]|nr:hypothetical protein [Candidatus Lokiarchaeota archaeon]MBD3198575.1 hypothetical protein [Candidatus Lokiarchaeota archaeon]
MKFPRLKSKDLKNIPFSIPNNFSKNLNIIIIPFKKSILSNLTSWRSFLRTLSTELSFIALYEFPIYSNASKIKETIIKGKFKQNEYQKSELDNIIPFYVNKRRFKNNLAILDEKEVHIFLLNREGEILWRSYGKYNLDKAQDLKRKIIENI